MNNKHSRGIWNNQSRHYLNLLGLFLFSSFSTLKAETTFEYLADRTEQRGSIQLNWFKEKSSGFSFFRIVSGISFDKVLTTNTLLKTYHDEYSQRFLDCKNTSDHTKSGIESLDASINYSSQYLLSFTFRSSSFCDGMKTVNIETTSHLYDLDTLEEMKLNDILNTNLSSNLAAAEYQKLKDKNILTVKEIRDLAFNNEGWPLVKHTDPESCDYYNLNRWSTNNWTFTGKGVEFYPSFPMISKTVCERPFLISFEQLDRYMKQTFTDNFGIL